MAAYLQEIEKPTCCRCGKRATHVLVNSSNATSGHYCRGCGMNALRILQKDEQVRMDRLSRGVDQG